MFEQAKCNGVFGGIFSIIHDKWASFHLAENIPVTRAAQSIEDSWESKVCQTNHFFIFLT